MIKTITYNLRNDHSSSTPFYQDLHVFTKQVAAKFLPDFNHVLESYMIYIQLYNLEPLRHKYEYIFDWLAFGVLWKQYVAVSAKTDPISIALLEQLYRLRCQHKKVKPLLDPLRGVLATLFLVKRKPEHFSYIRIKSRNINRFINYLDATGEFREEVKRFHLIAGFLRKNPELESIMYNVIENAGWFGEHAEKELGKYTSNVENFLQNEVMNHRWHEDYIFCSRKSVEYHLNMVGSELLNLAFRDEFLKTSKKAVLLPACMCAKHNGECKARKLDLDSVCTGCTANCRINYYTQLGREHGFEVHIIPHSTDFSTWLNRWAAGKDIGVIGVACLLNLMTGGLELKSLDIPAQCVFLDHCGCTNHWDKQGVHTDLNSSQLLKLLDTEQHLHRACA